MYILSNAIWIRFSEKEQKRKSGEDGGSSFGRIVSNIYHKFRNRGK